LNPPKKRERQHLGRIKKILYSKRVTILILVFFFLFSLRVINWFQYPNILISGDFRPPLIQDAFAKRVAYTWDETDFGMPSVYAPRILVPSNFFISVFQTLGVSLYYSEMMALILMFFLSSVFMFMFAKRITNGNIVASFIAALFLTSNLYMVNDREVTAISFVDVALVILPSLIAFTEGIRRKSYKFVAISGILFVLTYGAFPNFRVALLCIFAAMMVLLLASLNKGVKLTFNRKEEPKLFGFSVNISSIYTGLKYFAVFAFAGLLASVWVITIVWSNLGAFFNAYQQMSVPQVILDLRFHDVLRLITKWGFYSGSMDQPYVPYANVYLQNPLIIFLSYLPPLLAFASIFLSKERRLKVFFGVTAVVFLVLSDAFNPFLSQLYAAMATNIPLMLAFRESAQWTFFVIVAYGILIGLTISALCNRSKRRVLKILAISLTVIVFAASAYPITNGDVTRNYLDTKVKGAYFPDSYKALSNALSNNYWTLLLPPRSTYDTYNFSGIPLNSGNPYPLIFSKPVISGLGTEYVQSNNLDLLNKVYESVLTNEEVNVAPMGNASASSIEKDRFVPAQTIMPAQAIDGNYITRWASDHGMPQWLEIEWNETHELPKIRIVFENAYANDYTIETWNDTKWTTQIKVENNTNLEPEYTFSQLTPTTKLRINFTKASPFNMVSIWELQVYAKQTETVPKFLGMLGIKYLVLERDLVAGNISDANEIKINQSHSFVLTQDWSEFALYTNTYALQKLYPADNILNCSTLDDMFQTIEEIDRTTLQHSVFQNSTLTNINSSDTLVAPDNFQWNELSPTSYVARAQSKGPFVLAFLQSYDKNWKLTVNGKPTPEANHYEVNGFANAWLIDNTGDLTITLQYQTQTIFLESIIASIILPVLLMAYLSRKDLKRIGNLICRRLRSMKVKSKQEM
jgi:hypothetical protein